MLIPDVLDGLKARLETITGLTVSTDPGATIVVPMAVVTDADVTFNATMGRGSDDIEVIATVFVSRADQAEGAFEVREYKSGHGDRSVRAALETSTGATDPLTVAGVMVRVDSASTEVAARGDTSFIVVNVSLLVTVDGRA